MLADGDNRAAEAAADERAFRRDLLGCVGKVKGKTVALVRHPAALEDDCRSADIVIAPFTIGKRCRAARVIIDRRMLRAEGALHGGAFDPRRVGRRSARTQALGA